MDLIDIKGIGPKKKKVLENLGLFTIEDLLNYLPNRYEDRSNRRYISDSYQEGRAFYQLKILSSPKTTFYARNKSITRLKASDETGEVNIIWYNDRFTSKNLKKDEMYKFFGSFDKEKKAILNPNVSNLKDDRIGGIIPIYSIKKGITNNDIIKYKKNILENILIKDYLEEDFCDKYNILNINEIFKNINFPQNFLVLYKSMYSYNFRNLLLEKIANLIYRKKLDEKNIVFNKINLDEIYKKLDFELTKDQLKAIEDISENMTSNRKMNRILIGDVGSGKTIVAIISAIIAIRNGYQVAFMAPTEILASQHYEKYKNFLNDFNIKSNLLLGVMKKNEKENIYSKVKMKKIDILFGTHALFQNALEFSNLGLIITDEQQRFGVYQRKMLYDKGYFPEVLLLSATPIPRTLALSLYNDLDISFIETLPKNRLPIKTFLTDIYKEMKFMNFAYKEIQKKRQVYVVASRVEDDENLESVQNLYRKLSKYFKNKIKIDYLHGKLNSDEKQDIKNKFFNHEIDMLIATSIVEVGVDVPNASTIIIYDANQFGLSQLHQLRGRVGRGIHQSYCFFVVNKKEDYNEKMKFISSTNDGFEIAKKDLELRGYGELFGVNQSGFINEKNEFKFNLDLIEKVNKSIKDVNLENKYLKKIIDEKVKKLEKIILN